MDKTKFMSMKIKSYHLVNQSIAALWSCRWPAPWPALASVVMMTISSGKPVPSPVANMSVAIGMSVLRRTVHTPSPTWLLSRTMWVVSSCRSCRFSCTTSSCSESFGGVAVMRVNHDCSRGGSTQASWAREPHRHKRLAFGLFSARNKYIIVTVRLIVFMYKMIVSDFTNGFSRLQISLRSSFLSLIVTVALCGKSAARWGETHMNQPIESRSYLHILTNLRMKMQQETYLAGKAWWRTSALGCKTLQIGFHWLWPS